WKEGISERPQASLAQNAVARTAGLTAVALFLQLLVGAVMRHTKAGLAIPDFPLALGRIVPPLNSFPVAIHYLHRLGALAIAVLVVACVRAARSSRRPGLLKASAWLAALTLCQIALGAATVLTQKSVAVTTAHVAAGALLLGSTLALYLSALSIQRRR